LQIAVVFEHPWLITVAELSLMPQALSLSVIGVVAVFFPLYSLGLILRSLYVPARVKYDPSLRRWSRAERYVPVGHWGSAFDRLQPLLYDWRGDTNYRPINEQDFDDESYAKGDCCARCLKKRHRRAVQPASIVPAEDENG